MSQIQEMKKQTKESTKPTSLTVEQIISMSSDQIKEDIFKGIKSSKIVQKYRQLETVIHNVKNQYNLFILNVSTLAEIGIYVEVNYEEDEIRSYIQLIPYEIDMDKLMKYFADRLAVDKVC